MLTITIQKELRSIIQSPKFALTLIICAILILLSFYVGIQEYRENLTQYETATDLANKRLTESTSWAEVSDRVFRKPDPMQIFSSGVTFDIGRWSDIDREELVNIRNSSYSDDTIFALFRHIDLAMIVQVILSLLAILFTFDAVCGEKENGTLRLVFSNGVSRAGYLAGKAIGAWLGLIVPICVPMLLGLLLIQIYAIPLTGNDWIRVATLLGGSLLYVSFFVMLGVLLSTLFKRTSVSFLVSLVLWITFVLIIPRAGVIAAEQIVDVPGQAELEGQRDRFAKQRWNEHYDRMEKEIWSRNQDQQGEGFDDDDLWADMVRQDSARKQVQVDIDQFERRLNEDWSNRRMEARRLGFTLTRFSPAAAYQLAAMRLAGTDIGDKDRYLESMGRYRDQFIEHANKQQAESGQVGGVQITVDSEHGMTVSHSRGNDGIDLAGRPTFSHPGQDSTEMLGGAAVDFGILALATILAFAGAVLRFLKYDLR